MLFHWKPQPPLGSKHSLPLLSSSSTANRFAFGSFLAIASAIDDISNAEMCDRYMAGLRQEIADAVAVQPLPEGDFCALVAAAERVDAVKNQQRRGRKFEFKPNSNSNFPRPLTKAMDPSGASPMELDAINKAQQDKNKIYSNKNYSNLTGAGQNKN